MLLLDGTPEPPDEGGREWTPESRPGPISRLRTGAGARVKNQLDLARGVSGLLSSPRRIGSLPRQALGATGVLTRALRPAIPVSPLNEPISTRRRLARVERPIAEMQRIKSHFDATVNDVYLAIAAGAMRRLLIARDQRPRPLKTMVPVNVREDGEMEQLGNRISIMFVDLPCDEPDPELRLRRLQSAIGKRKRGGDPRGADTLLKLIGYAPRRLQRLATRVVGSPRMFNLTVSNIPGPREPMYMLGCELKAAYPVVPLPDRHALSIGMTTIQDRACFGLYADRKSLGDVDRVADAVERSSDELLALT
jgi:WS/DGAT/MGAT family acyltransferase